MRLLTYKEDGEIAIVSFDENDTPPYAILSHTWGADEDEVIFADIQNSDGKAKSGYKKIWFCGEQARKDGLKHFWIDTCCIDKTNKAELSHAIRSMFRWYQNATKCYVYLSDVRTKERKPEHTVDIFEWERPFELSRWFTRGWTLQELIAPRVVEFFSQDGDKLGEKSTLKSLINKITNIPPEALDGASMFQFSFEERLRWKSDRETKREEDAWYSMSGIFGVELAPAYSEGAASAFSRLKVEFDRTAKCTQDLHCTSPYDDKKRIEATKGGLLTDSYHWIFDNETFQQWQQDSTSRLLWVKGDPGKGKTMLLCGIIDELRKSMPTPGLLSYFFCQATDSRINSATAVLRGLLYMLVYQQPSLTLHIRKKYDQTGKSLFEDANAWIALTEIFVAVLQDPTISQTCLVIDALDECITDLPKLLNFVAQQSTASSRVKWIVSSRNWPDIETELERAGNKIKLSLELNAESVAMAVHIFIQQKVDQLAQEKQYQEELRSAVLEYMTSNANNTFLWVSLACQELGKTTRRHVLKKLTRFPPGLDALYERMMEQLSESDDAETCRSILACTAVLYRPVTIAELISLVEQLSEFTEDLDSVREIINLCGSFLTLREDTVYFVHQSAKEFLLANATATIFPYGTAAAHRDVLSCSLTHLTRVLHRNMASLETPGFNIANVMLVPETDPLVASRYSCVYWIDHLDRSETSSADHFSNLESLNSVCEFLKKKYLYWLEGLSLCQSVEKGVVSMTRLWSLVQGMRDQNELTKLVQDARRFLMYHKHAIESYPLQTYVSALLFSPTGSLIRQLFQHEEPKDISIRPAMSADWNACLLTLEGHSHVVTAVDFSHDSAKLASASVDRTVKLWDVSSGACLHTLKVDEYYATSIAFSHNSKLLAAVLGDSSIRLWDTSSAECTEIFKGRTDGVNSIVFSHDSSRLALASVDHTVKVWNTRDTKEDGQCLQTTLIGHNDLVNSVAFSHDSTRLASGSSDQSVRIWDIETAQCLQILTRARNRSVESVAFSHDSTQLASGSFDSTVKVWDLSKGICVQILRGHTFPVNSVAYSHNSAWLASASTDHTVKIWTLSNGQCSYTLEGHRDWVSSVAISHDSLWLASASSDSTIKVWDASIARRGTDRQKFTGHSNLVNSVAFSHDSAWLASGSDDHCVKIWDVETAQCLWVLRGHNFSVRSVAFSYGSAPIQLASGSDDYTIRIWDISKRTCLQTLHVDKPVSRIAYDRSGSWLATDIGTIPLASQAGSPPPPYHFNPQKHLSCTLNPGSDRPGFDCVWIMRDSAKWVWIPSEYRPLCSTISTNLIAFGVATGRVWICSLVSRG